MAISTITQSWKRIRKWYERNAVSSGYRSFLDRWNGTNFPVLAVPSQSVVRLNGIPVDRAGVIFEFDDGDSAEGRTDKHGKIEIFYYGWKGCPPRTAKVLVHSLPDEVPPGTMFACFSNDPPPPSAFPSRYGDRERPPFSVIVRKGTKNRFVLNLTQP